MPDLVLLALAGLGGGTVGLLIVVAVQTWRQR